MQPHSSGHTPARQVELTHSQADALITRDPHNYFMFSRDILRLGLSWEEAVLIQHLINVRRMLDVGEWFVCTVAKLEESMLVDRNFQSRLLNALIEKEWIKTERRGVPARRHIWVDSPRLAVELMNLKPSKPVDWVSSQLADCESSQLIDTSNPRQVITPSTPQARFARKGGKRGVESAGSDQTLPKSTSVAPTANSSLRSSSARSRRKKEKSDYAATDSMPRLIADVSATPIDPQCRDWAERLRKTLIAQKWLVKSPQITDWADEFRLLLDGCDGDAKRVELVVAWYEQNAANRDLIVPIKSAKAFRNRFEKDLEDKALGRHFTQTSRTSTKAPPSPLFVSEEAQRLAEELYNRDGWFHTDDLETAVEVSLTYANAVCRSLGALRDTIDPRSGHSADAAVIVVLEAIRGECNGLSPYKLTRKYLLHLYSKYRTWREWSGRLLPFAFGAKPDLVEWWIRQFADKSCGRTKGAKITRRIMEAIK